MSFLKYVLAIAFADGAKGGSGGTSSKSGNTKKGLTRSNSDRKLTLTRSNSGRTAGRTTRSNSGRTANLTRS